MRIAYLHQYYNTPSMPGGSRSYEFARRLAQRGHDVHVVTSDREGGHATRTTGESGVSVHWIPVEYSNHMSVARRLRSFASFAASAGSVARRLRPDLVFATSTPLTVAVPAIQAITGTSTPLVFEVRDLWPDVPIALGALPQPGAARLAYALERQAYRHSTRIIALGEGMRDGVVAAGFPRSATTVIPNAADIELFRGRDAEGAAFRASLPWLGDRPLVLYAGTLGQVNGVDYLARVAGAVRHLDPEVRFLVVGGGAEESRVRTTASSLGVLDETFHMMSPRPKSEMAALLSASTVATNLVDASTGLTGESANKMFDAMAAGRPVAVNWPGRLPAELEQVGAGLLLDSDPDRAGKRLVTALRDPAWLARARASSARLADERYSRDLLFDRFEEVLLEAHAEGRIVRRLRPREVAGV